MANNAWILLALTSAFFAALVAIFSKIGIAHLDSTMATMVRTFIMFVFLFLVVVSTNKMALIKQIDTRSLIFISLSAVCGALSWLAYFMALKMGSVSQVTALDRLSMVFVVFLAVFIGEPLCWETLLGALILSIGAAIIALC